MPVKGFDYSNLWTVTTVTDGEAGSIHVRTPVTPDGDIDAIRKVVYAAETIINGVMQIGFIIEADSLREAFDKFPAACAKAGREALEEAKSNQLRQLITSAPDGKLPRG